MIPVCFHIRVLHARSSVCRQRGGKSLNDWISKSQLFKKGSSMQNDSFIFRSLSLSIRIFVCPFGVCVCIFCLVSGLISEFHCDKWRNSSVSMHKVQKILYSFIFVQFISVKYCLKCEPSLSQVGCHCFVCRTS